MSSKSRAPASDPSPKQPKNRTSALCGVCDSAPPKYRCPTCVLRYCSVVCFKAHAPACCKEQPSEGGGGDGPGASSARLDNSAFGGADGQGASGGSDDADAVLLTDAQLGRLPASAEIVEALRDPMLRRILREVDAAPDRGAVLRHYRDVEGARFGRLLDSLLMAAGAAERDPATGTMTFVG